MPKLAGTLTLTEIVEKYRRDRQLANQRSTYEDHWVQVDGLWYGTLSQTPPVSVYGDSHRP